MRGKYILMVERLEMKRGGQGEDVEEGRINGEGEKRVKKWRKSFLAHSNLGFL